MSSSREIARAAGLIGTLTLLSRVGGLARDLVIGFLFGTGAAADAFFVAFRIPNLLRRFTTEGAMSAAFVPVLGHSLVHRGRAETDDAFRALLGVVAVLSGVLALGGILLASPLVAAFAPGFVRGEGRFDEAVRLTRMLFPYLFLINLAAVAGGYLNALRRFAPPALSPVLFNLGVIATALLLAPRLPRPVAALAVGVLLGGTAQVVVSLWPLRRAGVSIRPRWQPQHRAVRRVAVLLLPTLLAMAVHQVNALVGTFFASLLEEGAVSYLWYAGRLFEFPLGVLVVALGTAALPGFASRAARGEADRIGPDLSPLAELTVLLVIPAAVGLWRLADPIVSVLFERGAFAAVDVAQTARALRMMVLALLPVALARLLLPAFFALGDTRTPARAAVVALLVNAALSPLLMGPVATSETPVGRLLTATVEMMGMADLDHAGLALAGSLAAIAHLLTLRLRIGARVGPLTLLPRRATIVAILASLAMIIPLETTAAWADGPEVGVLQRLALLILRIALAAGTYAAVALALAGDRMRTHLRRRR